MHETVTILRNHAMSPIWRRRQLKFRFASDLAIPMLKLLLTGHHFFYTAMRSVVCVAALAFQVATAFTPPALPRTAVRSKFPLLFAQETSLANEAASLKAQAERIRLEAERMDAQLTLDKIDKYEKKLKDKVWLEKHPKEEVELLAKLDELNNRLQRKPPTPRIDNAPTKDGVSRKEKAATKQNRDITKRDNENPMAGFDPQDLELYLPIAFEIEERLGTNTTEEKLEAFRKAPELQEHFSNKIQDLIVRPMVDMQKLESLKSKYLQSSSSIEKNQLKRQIDALEKTVENESPFVYSDSVYRELPELTEEEIEQRVQAIQELPQVLQALYMKRNEVEGDDLRLAIQVEHFEPQTQLLDQIRFVSPFSEKTRAEALMGYQSLPGAVQDYFCRNIGMEAGSEAADVIAELEGGKAEMNFGFGKVVMDVTKSAEAPPEYSDIEFLDRSRYVEELIPAFARMEETRPTEEEIETFCSEILDKSTFTLTSKPERVLGGYYLQGINRLGGDDANDVMVARLIEKLQMSSLKGDVQFFFIPDPMALTDEEIETGDGKRPLLAITSKNLKEFYGWSRPTTKALISAGGVLSTCVFALGACAVNDAAMDKLQVALDAGSTDVSWLTDMFGTIVLSMLGIQLVHEAAHRVIAWRDKFDIGLPNLIPSVTLGLGGAITPFKSPPKNWNSMFDFAIAGPLAGMIVSIFLLYMGLSITASMDMAEQSQLPALPVLLLHASALGGGLIESFLGSGVLTTATPETSVLLLHPLAIGGYIGLISNALSLLPVGNTDGGRVSLSMFGRRGTFLVKTFSILTICAVGLFGFDESRILILYALFVILWQREIETPALNEVDDLDAMRGIVGIASAVLVALTLIPFP